MQLLLAAMDDAAANWYSYHFHDTLFLNDTFWVYWHIKLQEMLSEDQLLGKACAFCGSFGAVDNSPSPSSVRKRKDMHIEHIAGYTIACCKEPCHIAVD